MGERWKRPCVLEGKTVRVISELGRLYITVNTDEGGEVKEVFVHLGKAGTHISSLVEALGRVISVALQYGVPVGEIIGQLRGIRSGVGIMQEGGGVVFSVPDGIGYGLELVLGSNKRDGGEGKFIDLCPDCGGRLVKIKDCYNCIDCGYSKRC